MIIGIGIDLVSVERLEAAMNRHGVRFTHRVFTYGERGYCESRKRGSESFAARFAVKEAAFKALGHGWDECGGFTAVEVTVGERGRPDVVFHGKASDFARSAGVIRTHVTITHDNGMAAAVVVLEA